MMLTYVVYKESEPIESFYTGDDALRFIEDNNYKIYTMYYGGHDTFIIEVIKNDN